MKQLASVIVLGALACVLAAPAAADGNATVVRVFQLKYRTAAAASAAIQPLLSAGGSVTVQPQRAVLTVQDQPQVLERVAELLAVFDRPPHPYRIRVQLLEAHNGPLPKGVQPVDVDGRVRSMFHYDSYVELASTMVEGTVGHTASVQLGPAYGLSFEAVEPPMISARILGQRRMVSRLAPRASSQTRPDADGGEQGAANSPAPRLLQRVILREVRLWKSQLTGEEKGKVTEILRSNAMLGPGQKVVLGAGASEASPTAVVLMLEAVDVREK